MKRREGLAGNQLTELQKMIRSKKSDNVEIRREQAILLVNNLTDEFIIKSVTGLVKKVEFKLKRR